MQNIGEEICGEYLKHIKKCDFVSYNVSHPDVQGEIDVVGISLEQKTIYICEVATHTGGLQYVTDDRPDNFNRFNSKFKRSIDYAKKYFPNYPKIILMLWSPIVRVATEKAKYDPYSELLRLKSHIDSEHALDLELIVNKDFLDAMKELKAVAYKTTAAFNTSSVMRIFQIETNLEKHVVNLSKRKSIRAA